MTLLRTIVPVLFAASCAEPSPPAASAPRPVVTAAPAPPPAPPRNAYGYPETRRTNTVEVLHGASVADPYRWLEDEKSPAVQSWMKAQDDFARARLAELPKRAELAKRFRELYDIEHLGPPIRRGGRQFWTQKDVGKDKDAVLFREGKRGAPKVLLDPNTWSKDGTVSLGSWTLSWDGKYVAYQVKRNNSDEAILEVLEIATGKKLPDALDGAKYVWRTAWNREGTGFYYTKVPPVGGKVTVADRPGFAEIRFHRLGTDPAQDPLVREATGDPKTFHTVDASKDGRYLLAFVRHGWISTDVYVQDLREKKPSWKPFVVGQPYLYGVDAHAGRFYVTTNEGAPNWRMFRVDPAKLERAAWTEIVPERKDAIIDEVAIVGGRLSLVLLKDVARRLEVHELDGKLAYEVALPEPGTVSNLVGNDDEDEAHYEFQSFGRPPEVHSLSVRTGKGELKTKTAVPVDSSRILTEQRFAVSKDGTKVPYFVVRDKDRPLDGTAPTLLNAYGGFGVALSPAFTGSAYPWLENGGVYVLANLRGGSEYGENWHQAGMRLKKQNVFDDFFAVAEDLVAKGYTKPERLVIRGRSNGGLLVGAAMTQRPELFRAVICGVPLLDMVRYHLFGSGKTWIQEYGSADDAADFRALFGYSPYHHVKDGVRYPSVILSAADSDDRVDPMHARKFAALLQHASAGGPVLLRIQRNAGHGGADKIDELVAERADEYAFALSELGR